MMSVETVGLELFDAARDDDVTALEQIRIQLPAAFESRFYPFSRNILHLATSMGSINVVERLLQINESLARTRDDNNASPLRIAAEAGHPRICEKLLSVAPEVCDWLDRNNRNPFHIAIMKGHAEIINMILSKANTECCLQRCCDDMNSFHIAAMKGLVETVIGLVRKFPFIVRVRLRHGETVLHLCVKHKQFQVLEALVGELGDDLVDERDESGEKITHLAVRGSQLETIKYLVDSKKIKSLTRNSKGKTELEILDQMPPGSTDYVEIKRILSQLLPPSTEDVLPQMSNMTMVVAVLVGTITFQNAGNPPGGLWQGDTPLIYNTGHAIIAYTHPYIYRFWMLTNAIAFSSSFFSISLIITGWTSTHLLLFRIASCAMWVSLIALAANYAASVLVITPKIKTKSANAPILLCMFPIGAVLFFMILILILFRFKKHILQLLNALFVRCFRAGGVRPDRCLMFLF